MEQNSDSNENYKLLDIVKQYLRIEHKENDKDLLDYIKKQAGFPDNE
jgi:hypothetical protein